MSDTANERLLRLNDRIEIQELLYRYARGVDRKDWQAVRAVYHPDAFDDHGNYTGDIDGFIASLQKRHAHIEQSMHVIANCIIEFDTADSALVESYFITYQRILPSAGDGRASYLLREPLSDDEAVQGQAVGRYVDRVTRRTGEWRIEKRAVVYEVYSGVPTMPGGRLRDNWTVSARDGQDPIERLRAELGLGGQDHGQ
jgi:hypothetical protein